MPPEEDAVSVNRHWQGGTSKAPDTIGTFPRNEASMHFMQTAIGLASQAFDGKCRSYDPGRAPHYIQLRKAFESIRVPADWVGIEPQTTVKFLIDGNVRSFYNHHPETIQDLLTAHSNSTLTWVEHFRVLIIETPGAGGFAFNLSRESIETCN